MATIPLVQQQELPISGFNWKILPVANITDDKQRRLAYRLNCLGSLFYFIKVGLQRHRLVPHVHYPLTLLIENTHVHNVIEWPRDHFKTTIFGEGASMWWSLPFSQEDEYTVRSLRYGDEFIRWMKAIHNIDTRTLIVSEVIDNAIKIGMRIDHHYKNNDRFRWLFPEIIPDTSCVWNAKTMTHKRTKSSPNGEGTFDFLGVGSALQSRHYDRVIEDDIFGRDAAHSEKMAADSIDYHRKLVGAFDSSPDLASELNDEIIVGNRWCFNDLNQWIRENESELHYNFTTHDAEGGCCNLHPPGQPIFPEEWTLEKLKKAQIKLGTYDYSCQYRNNPTPPGMAEFQESWLRFYSWAPVSETDVRAKIIHNVYHGEVIPDLMPSNLRLELITDPAHSDSEDNDGGKRCRHAILVVGFMSSPQRFYLFEAWAKACTYHEYVAKIYEFLIKYKLKKMWLETIAAQGYLKLYLDYRNTIEGINVRVEPLKTDKSPGAKKKRIRGTNTYYQECQVWLRQCHQDFILEYNQFPYGKTVDLLDTFGYVPQIVRPGPSNREINEWLLNRQQEFESSRSRVTGY
jgi:hypothetical protein